MDGVRRRWLPVAASAAVLLSCGCSSKEARERKALAEFAENPPKVLGPARLTAVNPNRLTLSGDRIAAQALEVSYAIDNPASVTNATLELLHPDLGTLAKMDVPVQATGVAQFVIEPEEHSLGPMVRFRASCPNGVTNWHTMGQIEQPFDARRREAFGIHMVKPESVRASQIPYPPPDPSVRASTSNGEIVYVRGGGLTTSCRLEMQVDGVDVTLGHLNLTGQEFQGLLYLRDIDFKPVARRYAVLNLNISRKVGGYIATERLGFVEPE